jgi:hypothetical protein
LGAFAFRLEREDGTPADPPTLRTVVRNWSAGATIPLARDRMLRVIENRPASGGEDEPVLVVEPVKAFGSRTTSESPAVVLYAFVRRGILGSAL